MLWAKTDLRRARSRLRGDLPEARFWIASGWPTTIRELAGPFPTLFALGAQSGRTSNWRSDLDRVSVPAKLPAQNCLPMQEHAPLVVSTVFFPLSEP